MTESPESPPGLTIVHKQDYFIEERYRPAADNADHSFLSQSFERHFFERPFLKHSCYLFITKTTPEQMRRQSNFSTLCRGYIIPKEIRDKDAVSRFLDAIGQMESILNDSGLLRLEQMSGTEIVGSEDRADLSPGT